MIGIDHADKYIVEEVMQLLKVPWEWYDTSRKYDVVITKDNVDFLRIHKLLNEGEEHLHYPKVDVYINDIRNKLIQSTTLVEIPPSPWGYNYMVALTHDVDVISARQSRILSLGSAVLKCFLKAKFGFGLRLLMAKLGLCTDPWELFEKWKSIESDLYVKSTFFIIPNFDKGISSHPYRDTHYDINPSIIKDLIEYGWEVGTHGINGWTSTCLGNKERIGVGNRTHWLLHNQSSWSMLDDAGYDYDSTFGYDTNVGFRAGTLQVYKPDNSRDLLELPLHIQDAALFGKMCWVKSDDKWVISHCLNLDNASAYKRCMSLLDYGRRFGGVITILWHYENITEPRDWLWLYRELVLQAKKDGAWVTNAINVVEWFKLRRAAEISSKIIDKTIKIHVDHWSYRLKVRVYIDPESVDKVNGNYAIGDTYIDVQCAPDIEVTLK